MDKPGFFYCPDAYYPYSRTDERIYYIVICYTFRWGSWEPASRSGWRILCVTSWKLSCGLHSGSIGVQHAAALEAGGDAREDFKHMKLMM